MPDLDEAFTGLAADAAGGGIGSDEFGMGVFEPLQFAHQGVVLGVGDFGRVEHVVLVLVVTDLRAERFNFLGDGAHGDAIL